MTETGLYERTLSGPELATSLNLRGISHGPFSVPTDSQDILYLNFSPLTDNELTGHFLYNTYLKKQTNRKLYLVAKNSY